MGPSRHYRGWRSTKLHLSLIICAAMLAGFYLVPDRGAVYGALCSGLVTAAGLYCGAQAAEKFAK